MAITTGLEKTSYKVGGSLITINSAEFAKKINEHVPF